MHAVRVCGIDWGYGASLRVSGIRYGLGKFFLGGSAKEGLL